MMRRRLGHKPSLDTQEPRGLELFGGAVPGVLCRTYITATRASGVVSVSSRM